MYSLKHGQDARFAGVGFNIGIRKISLPLSLCVALSLSLFLCSFALILFIYFCYRFMRVDFCFDSRSNYRSFTWVARHFVVLDIARAIWIYLTRAGPNEHYISFPHVYFLSQKIVLHDLNAHGELCYHFLCSSDKWVVARGRAEWSKKEVEFESTDHIPRRAQWEWPLRPTEGIRFNEENIYLLLFSWSEVYVPSTFN